jgi:hypothetical protein
MDDRGEAASAGAATDAGSDAVRALVEELERTARALRAEDLDGREAAEAVERCAEAANRLGAELDRLARARPEAGGPAQEALL